MLPAEDVILIYGWDWNSLIPYYAERRAIMAPGTREHEFKTLDQILANLPPRRIAAMLVKKDAFNATPRFIRERATRFGLFPLPFATSPDGDLYLPEKILGQADRQIAGQKYATVNFPTDRSVLPLDDGLKEADLSGLDLSFLTPSPVRARSLFGLSLSEINDRPVLNAHAPSELTIMPPAGATRLTAEFGLAEGAYSGEGPLTDGVGVSILEIKPDGSPQRILFQRELDPVRNPADRGMQQIDLPITEPVAGPLIFRIDPGPKENLVKDWACWTRIEIH